MRVFGNGWPRGIHTNVLYTIIWKKYVMGYTVKKPPWNAFVCLSATDVFVGFVDTNRLSRSIVRSFNDNNVFILNL